MKEIKKKIKIKQEYQLLQLHRIYLKDDTEIGSSKIKNQDTIHLLMKLKGANDEESLNIKIKENLKRKIKLAKIKHKLLFDNLATEQFQIILNEYYEIYEEALMEIEDIRNLATKLKRKDILNALDNCNREIIKFNESIDEERKRKNFQEIEIEEKKIIKLNKEEFKTENQIKRLKGIELAKFYGNITQFDKWWNQFKNYIDDSDMPPMEKMLYLENTLGGEPRERVKNLGINEEAYEEAIRILHKIYGGTESTFNSIFNELKEIKEIMPNDLRALDRYTSTLSCINLRLKNINREGTNDDIILLKEVTKKIPDELLEKWTDFKKD